MRSLLNLPELSEQPRVNADVFNCYEQTVVSAMGQKFHAECFTCFQCHKPICSGLFHLENGEPYCDAGMMESQVVQASLLL